RENPEETQIALTDKGQPLHAPGYNHYSFASDKWQQDFGFALQQLLQHCEKSAYRQRIIGYCPMSGDGGEWSYGFRNYLSDYSEPQRRAFSKYAQNKYNNSLSELQKAWNSNEKSFADIQIPDYQRRLQGDLGLFFDPRKSQKIIDFNQHFSHTVITAIRHMGQIIRNHAPGKLSCFYYGYHFMPGTQNGDLVNTGHRALAELLQAPEIDAIGSPQMYYNRSSGGAALSQTVVKSIQLNNKLWLNEDDTRTYLTGKFWPNFPPPFEKNYDASLAVLLRNAAFTLFKSNGRLMWMEMGVNWFNHPGFIALAQKIRADKDFQLSEKPEVVLVVSDSSYNHMRFSRELSEPLLARSMMHTFTKLGAPIDTILLSDLEKAPDYRLYVFMDCCILNQQQIDIIQAKVKRNQASVLWMYAPGFGDGEKLALANSEKLTGFKLDLIEDAVSIRVRGQEALTAQLAPMLIYAGSEPGLDSLEMTFRKQTCSVPILQKKTMPGSWTSYWCGAPLITLSGLQRIAAAAGVHLFSQHSDQVFYNGRLLVVHAETDGNRDIALPETAMVFDWMTEEQITPTKTNHFTINMNSGETIAFRILK
ncbi:MAG: beta-galactosidase, partial [Lentisphaeria bacterium]